MKLPLIGWGTEQAQVLWGGTPERLGEVLPDSDTGHPRARWHSDRPITAHRKLRTLVPERWRGALDVRSSLVAGP